MSYILFYAPSTAPPPVVTVAFKFNVAANSMYLPLLAAWPMSPLVVP